MANDNTKAEKPVKYDKNGKPKLPLKSRVKALFGELRKVTYPTLKKTASKTGTVLVVTLVFLVVLFGMDMGLQALFRLLTGPIEAAAAVLPLL